MRSKRCRVTSGLLAAVSLASLGVAACRAGAAGPADDVPDSRVVITTGDAIVRRAADQAFVTVSAESRAQNPKTAQTRNAEIMNRVRERLKEAAVPDSALRTVSYELSREYDYVKGRTVFREYLVKNAVEVRLDDVTRVGEAIDLAIAAGATSVDGPRFELREREAVAREALKQAAADAHAKAQAAAAGAGGTLADVVQIEEHGASEEGPRRTTLSAFSRAGAAEPRPPTTVAPGTIEIRAKVTLTAALK